MATRTTGKDARRGFFGMGSSLTGAMAKGGREDVNKATAKDLEDSCAMLHSLCESKAKTIEFISQDRRRPPSPGAV